MQVYQLMLKFLLGADFPPIERLRFMFMPKGKRELVPNCLLLLLKNK